MNSTTLEPGLTKQEPSEIWNRSFIILFFTSIAFNMGMEMSNSLTTVYANHLGAPASVVGFVASSYAVTSIFFRLISSPVMDTYNRKYLVIFAAFMLSVVFWGFSISDSVPMLIAFRLLQGCVMAFGNACCLAMVADMLPKARYSSGIGYYSLTLVACGAIGPSVGLALVDRFSFRITFTLAACFMLLAACLVFLIKLDFKRTKKLKLTFHNIIATEALLPLSVQFITVLGGTCVWSFLFVYARERGVTGNIGLYYTFSAVTLMISRPLVGRLTDRYGLVRIAAPAMLFNVATILIICYSTTLKGILIAAVVTAFGQGAVSPAIQALTMKSVPVDRRGAASSSAYISMDLSSLISAVIAGQIVQHFGYTMMWYYGCAPYLAAALVLIAFRKKVVRIEEEFAAR